MITYLSDLGLLYKFQPEGGVCYELNYISASYSYPDRCCWLRVHGFAVWTVQFNSVVTTFLMNARCNLLSRSVFSGLVTI